MRTLAYGFALIILAGCGARQHELTCRELPDTVTATPPPEGGRAVESLANFYMAMASDVDELRRMSRPAMAAGPAATDAADLTAVRAAHGIGLAGYTALHYLVRAGIDVSSLHQALRELLLAVGEADILMESGDANRAALREPVAAAMVAALRTTQLIRAAFSSAVDFHAPPGTGRAAAPPTGRLRCLEARISAHEAWDQLVIEIERVLSSDEEWQSDTYFGSKGPEEADRQMEAPDMMAPAEAMDVPSIRAERREQTFTELLRAAQRLRTSLADLDITIGELIASVEERRTRFDPWNDAMATLRAAGEICEEP